MKIYPVTCPTCNKERIVSRIMAWHIRKGHNKNCKSCSLKGNTYGNGVVHTEEFKEMKRRQMTGNQWALGQRGMIGPENPQWKGGVLTQNRKERNSLKYSKWRISVFERDNYTCQDCGHRGKLMAHHIKPFADYPELRLDIENGRTLCDSCHKALHKLLTKGTNHWQAHKASSNIMEPHLAPKQRPQRSTGRTSTTT